MSYPRGESKLAGLFKAIASFTASACCLLLFETARADAPKTPIGKKVDNFTLRDFHGQPYSLDEIGKDKVVVLAFLGTECPLATRYAPRLF